ncbi:monomeric sarcosine oxidase-like isoform X3 [Amphiura filiformis]|uniref:monomeric sarcosine oxidase-like isoform X3 n=1 Tax=Amphiura filiformis TaxID=82378 RepID=UPI003B21256C
MARNQSNFYDYIVVGCGGVGSATLYWLTKKTKRTGASVLGLEQFKLGHDNGGSQDVSRIIRLYYHEDYYTALARGAYNAWEEVERDSGEQLVFKTGGLILGKKGTIEEQIVYRYANSLKKHEIPFEMLEGKALRQRFPQFTADNLIALYQKEGGLVDAARGNSTHIQLAEANGATVLENATVSRIGRQADGTIVVYSSKGVFTCRRVIIIAGAWLNNVLRSIGLTIPVTVTQEQVTFFRTPHIKDCGKSRFPVFSYTLPEFNVYGLPPHGNTYFKLGIDAGMSPTVTAETRNFKPDPKREKFCVDFLKENIPKFLGPIAYTKTCLYTMTPDRNFVIDTCAKVNFPEVIVCCGAGHAYKFASILGKTLSDLALNRKPSYNLEPFKVDRPAITDPTFKKDMLYGREALKAKIAKSNL